ncbi:MAG: VRR-NUC domain-containing protein [Phycisphaerae bacterium]
MVGRKLAIFAAVEVKTERGRITVDQLNFIEQVRSAGGIAGIARSPEDARNLLETYL